MRRMVLTGTGLMVAVFAGCGPTTTGNSSSSSGAVCDASADYVPFDASRGQSLRDMTAAQAQIKARMREAGFAKANMPEIRAIYADTSGLAAAVQALGNVPSWEAANVGASMHAAILDAIARGEDTQDTTELVELRQIIDKTLTRFFFLSTLQHAYDTTANTEEHLDLAWAAYGRKSDGTNTGLAATVDSYDTEFGTSQNELALDALSQGRCAVLASDTAAQQQAAARVDEAVRVALAYGVTKYFRKLSLGTGSRGDFMEGATYFNAIEPWMRANGKAAQADTVRDWIDPFHLDGANSTALPDTDGASAAITAIEAAFSL